METVIYNLEGKKTGEIVLPDKVFNVRWNSRLVKQVVDSLLISKRVPLAHTKNRGEVRGGGKKPWRQKGTGRARHGSIRSPIWVGGGVTHGPRNEKNFDRKVSKKMRTKALHTILSQKFREGEVLFVDSVSLKEPKTKLAVDTFKTLSSIKGFENLLSKKKNAAVVATLKKDKNVEKAFGNISNTKIVETKNLDPISLLQYKYLLVENPKESLKVLPGSKEKNE